MVVWNAVVRCTLNGVSSSACADIYLKKKYFTISDMYRVCYLKALSYISIYSLHEMRKNIKLFVNAYLHVGNVFSKQRNNENRSSLRSSIWL